MTVPSLRFKKFDRDWSINKIEEISIVTSGGTPSRSVREYWSGNIPWVTTSLVDFNVINEAKEFITQVGLDNSSAKLFPKDTILMAMYGQGITRGKVAILGIEATTNQACAAIKLKNGFDTKFIFQNLMNRYEEIRDLSNEGGQKNLSAGIIKEILISFPEKEEQTKIASFLSAVDEKISQLTQKHQLLSQYKQGMMQKLFSQQIRFKADDGSEFGEWEKLTLSQISKHIGGTALESYVSECGDYNFISIGNYSTNGKYIDNSQRIILNEKTGTKLLDKDDLVMVLNDKTATGDLIGSTILINEDNKYIYNQRSERIICNKSKVLSVYLWHFLNSEMMRSEVRKLAQGGTQIYINFSSVLSIIFLLPCLAEQNKIANFLSAIDQKIEVVAQQIEQAKIWKKGLLQQMFV